MPNWKKIIVSGSAGNLSSLSVDNTISASIISANQFTGSLYGTASEAISSSYASTSSWALYAITASRAINTVNADSATSASHAINSNNAITASYITFAQTASYALSAVSSSYSLTASYAANVPDTASYALQALSSSYALSSSFALTASYALNSSTVITGSNAILNQTVAATTWSFVHNLNSQYPVFQVFDSSNSVIIPQSIIATSPTVATIYFPSAIAGTAVASIGGYTGSVTASYFLSASYALSSSYAVSSSYTLSSSYADSSSYALSSSYAISSSYALSSSYAVSSSYALSSSYAISSSYALSSSYAVSSSYALSSSYAISSSYALTASKVSILDDNGNNSHKVLFVNTTVASGGDQILIDPTATQFTYNPQTNLLVVTASLAQVANSAQTASYVLNAVSASYASNADLLDGLNSTVFVQTGSYNTFSSSIAGRTSLIETTYATTGSNTFAGTQYISNVANAISFTSTASLYTDGGARITKDLYVSGTTYLNNLTVFGTSSVNYITSSTLVGLEFINLNTDLPALRYAGINVGDSGSAAGISSSFWYDSTKDNWLYVYAPAGAAQQTSSLAINGPITYNNVGNEQGLLGNYIVKSQLLTADNNHHITSSQIFDDGTTVAIAGNLQVTGSLSANATSTIPFNVGGTSTYYGTINSSIVGSNNIFTLNTGSYTAATFQYTAYNGSNSRAGQIIATWNNGTAQFTDFAAPSNGSTTAVTASVTIVSSQLRLNFQTNTSAWTIKSQGTLI